MIDTARYLELKASVMAVKMVIYLILMGIVSTRSIIKIKIVSNLCMDSVGNVLIGFILMSIGTVFRSLIYVKVITPTMDIVHLAIVDIKYGKDNVS